MLKEDLFKVWDWLAVHDISRDKRDYYPIIEILKDRVLQICQRKAESQPITKVDNLILSIDKIVKSRYYNNSKDDYYKNIRLGDLVELIFETCGYDRRDKHNI